MKITAESKYDIGEMVRVDAGEQVIEAEITGIQAHVDKEETTIIYFTDVIEIETVVESHIIGKGTPRAKSEPYYADPPF